MCTSAGEAVGMNERVVAAGVAAAAAETAAAGIGTIAAGNGVDMYIDYESHLGWPLDSNPIWLKSLAM